MEQILQSLDEYRIFLRIQILETYFHKGTEIIFKFIKI